MTEQDVAAAILSSDSIIDTLLNVEFFIFIGIIIWLYTSAPTTLDD